MNDVAAATGKQRGVRVIRAPARVNLIGEHTDYNGGFVLPTTTSLYTTVEATPRTDRTVAVRSHDLGDAASFDLDDLSPGQSPRWIDYAAGVADGIEAADIRLCGANLSVRSAIPLGGGLSSSASFELAVAHALLSLSGASLPAARLAKICQLAENRYAGVNCGIMDQYAVACCETDKALLLDCRSLAAEQVSIPPRIALLLVHSGVTHQLSDGEYNDRAGECAAAVAIIARRHPGVTSLRDVDVAMLEALKDRLGARLYRLARHVVRENQRVHTAFVALANDDLDKFGEQVSASHASLRDDYDVSCAEVDRLVEIARRCPGVTGSRMVGAGFGGCVLVIVEADRVDDAAKEIGERYAHHTGTMPWTHVVSAAAPAGIIRQ